MSNQTATLTAHQDQITAMQAGVTLKAQKDPAFRAALVADPKGTLEKHWGTSVPADVKFVVVESAPNTVTIALPFVAKPGAGGELSDSDLEAVAGGSKAGAETFFKGAGSVALAAASQGGIILNECF